MSVRVVYTECSCQPWYDVASLLKERHGWEPVYWTGHGDCRHEVVGRFPAAIYHDNYDAARCIAPEGTSHWPRPPVDEQLLVDLAAYESIAMRMMDRMDPDDSFTYPQRVRLYQSLLSYWLGALTHLKPDLVVFPCAPHLVYDYVLYALCKRMGIKTLLIKETYVGGMIYPQGTFENASPELMRIYSQLLAQKQDGEVELSPKSRAFIDKVRGSYEQAQPYYLKEFLRLYKDGAPKLGEPGHREPARDPRSSVWTGVVQTLKRWKASFDAALDRYWPHRELAWEIAKTTLDQRIEARKDPARYAKMLTCQKIAFEATDELIRNEQLDELRASQVMACMSAAFEAAALALRKKNLSAEAVREAMEITLYLYDQVDYPKDFVMAPAPRQYFVRKGEDHIDKNRMSGLEYRLYRRLAEAKKNDLYGYYHELAKVPDLTQPYIYMAMNYQPEQTTSPEGGAFVNQYLAVRMLSCLAPAGWKIYVKDHPVQLHAATSGEPSRFRWFYRDLAELPNVSLVPLDFSTFQLIDGAKAVATVNGTAAWEAVVRGKPSLVFGHVWFRGCEGVFYVPTETACREALRRVQDGFKPELRKVQLFLRALETLGYRACSLPEGLEFAGLTPEQSAQGMAQALVDLAGSGEGSRDGRESAAQAR